MVNFAIADLKIGKKYPFNNGIYMIPTGEYAGANTVYNKIVYTDGNFENPSIIKVLEINKGFEDNNQFVSWLFKEYRNGFFNSKELFNIIENYSAKQTEIFFREYSCEDFGNLSEFEQQGKDIGANNENNQREQNGTGNNEKTKFSLKDSIEKDVTKEYGTTYNWRETGYILTDGEKVVIQ